MIELLFRTINGSCSTFLAYEDARKWSGVLVVTLWNVDQDLESDRISDRSETSDKTQDILAIYATDK